MSPRLRWDGDEVEAGGDGCESTDMAGFNDTRERSGDEQSGHDSNRSFGGIDTEKKTFRFKMRELHECFAFPE